MNATRSLIYRYLELMGQALGHPQFTNDNRLVVHECAKQIMRVTEHGSDVHHDLIQDLAQEAKALPDPFAR